MEEMGYVKIVAPACGWVVLKITQLGIEYFEGAPQQNQATIFNFNGDIQNAIVGSQTHATLNAGICFDELQSLISQIQGPDKEALESLVLQLQQMSKGEKEIKPGVFSKFAEILNKYPGVITALGTMLTGIVTQGLMP